MEDVFTRIESVINSNDIVLFMKGNKTMPQCGFSSLACNILNKIGVDFADVNVLEDQEIRHAIKEYSDWPTIPQLYVKKEFIGGSDIMKQLFESGELQKIVENCKKL